MTSHPLGDLKNLYLPRVGMTGPVIRGRAGRTPLPLMPPGNHPVSGLPLSAVSPRVPMSPCPHAPAGRIQHSTIAPCLT